MPASPVAAPAFPGSDGSRPPPPTPVADALLRLRRAFRSLRGHASATELVQRVPEAVSLLGFDLVLYSDMHQERWTPVAAHGGRIPHGSVRRRGGPASSTGLIALPAARSLDGTCPERTVLEERRPALVDTVEGGGGLVPGWPCPVVLVVPVIDRDVVVGMLHVARVGGRGVPGPVDEEIVRTFAETIGALISAARTVDSVRDIAGRMAGLAHELAPPRPADTAVGDPAGILAPATLTSRETAVLELVAGGLTNGQIARRLVITEGTVKSHVKRILRKMGAANRAEAAAAWTRTPNEGLGATR